MMCIVKNDTMINQNYNCFLFITGILAATDNTHNTIVTAIALPYTVISSAPESNEAVFISTAGVYSFTDGKRLIREREKEREAKSPDGQGQRGGESRE